MSSENSNNSFSTPAGYVVAASAPVAGIYTGITVDKALKKKTTKYIDDAIHARNAYRNAAERAANVLKVSGKVESKAGKVLSKADHLKAISINDKLQKGALHLSNKSWSKYQKAARKAAVMGRAGKIGGAALGTITGIAAILAGKKLIDSK